MPNDTQQPRPAVWTDADKEQYAKALELAFELMFERIIQSIKAVKAGTMTEEEQKAEAKLLGCITGATAFALHDVSRHLEERRSANV